MLSEARLIQQMGHSLLRQTWALALNFLKYETKSRGEPFEGSVAKFADAGMFALFSFALIFVYKPNC
jgi:hypothetical protein